MGRLGQNPPPIWRKEIVEFLEQESAPLIARYQKWTMLSNQLSENGAAVADDTCGPDFPLLPASKGFCLTLNKSIQVFESTISNVLKSTPTSNHDVIPNVSLNSTEESNLSR